MDTMQAYVHPSLQAEFPSVTPKTHSNDGSSAKVSWEPNYAEYVERAVRRLETEQLLTELPSGWPARLKGGALWTGSSFKDAGEYVYELSKSEIQEIGSALKHFNGLNLSAGDVSTATFPLPTLGPKLRLLAQELHTGKGFFVLRGLNPAERSGADNALIFVGVSSYIGASRGRQDGEGNMLVHILDAASSLVGSQPREAQSVYTSQAQPYHSDVVCDILALQTMGNAAKGGESAMASVAQIYNELAATRPDLIDTLACPDWIFDTFGRTPAYHRRALLFQASGKPIINFSRRLLTGSSSSPRTPGLPPITEAQAEALDAVHFLAAKYELKVAMQPGDMRFINNLAILHRRDAFRDGDDAKRHIMRLWLRNEELAWPTPEGLKMPWARVFRSIEEIPEKWELEPDLTVARIVSKKAECGQG